MYKIIKTTVLVAGLFGFVGCDSGSCCESDSFFSKGEPFGVKDNPIEKPKVVPNGGKPTVIPFGGINPLPPVVVINDSVDLITVGDSCTVASFTSIGTYDPDGNDENLTYKWTDIDGTFITDETSFDYKYEEDGMYETTLTVTDEQNLTTVERLCVLVGIDESDMPLVADAGVDVEASVDENVTLSGRAVCRKDFVGYRWEENGEVISYSPTFTKIFSEGSHEVKLIVEDFAGNETCDRVTVTVK